MPKDPKKKQPARPAALAKTKGKAKPKAKPAARRAKAAKPIPVLGDVSRGAVMDRLWNVVLSRREADPTISHSARLLSRGMPKVAQKFGEEAVECLIEAVSGNHDALVAESADVLYHLIVMWVAAGVEPNEVWAELERREGISGVLEKASRTLPVALAPQTKKIP